MKSRSPQFFASGGTREVTCGKVTPWSNDAATTGYHCPPLASMTRIDCLFHLCVLPGARTTEVTDRTYTIRWPGPKRGGQRQEACGSADSDRQSNPPPPPALHCPVRVSLAHSADHFRHPPPVLTRQQSGTLNRRQAVSPVDSRVVWASGVGGTYVVTTDGGATWRAGVVAGAEQLQFRDVQGVSATVAYLLSAGVGPASRIYKTGDGGASWSLQFQSLDPDAFYDCFAFWTAGCCMAMSDAVNAQFPVIQTTDGTTWTDIGDRLPAAQLGE